MATAPLLHRIQLPSRIQLRVSDSSQSIYSALVGARLNTVADAIANKPSPVTAKLVASTFGSVTKHISAARERLARADDVARRGHRGFQRVTPGAIMHSSFRIESRFRRREHNRAA